jgi:hypothetical protein
MPKRAHWAKKKSKFGVGILPLTKQIDWFKKNKIGASPTDSFKKKWKCFRRQRKCIYIMGTGSEA